VSVVVVSVVVVISVVVVVVIEGQLSLSDMRFAAASAL
jgi:hypothetical protein